jgi:hypothetical protein
MSEAFPLIKSTLDSKGDLTAVSSEGGLSKREFYACFAMVGHFILNADSLPDEKMARKFAKGAVYMADALIKELGMT